MWVDEFGNAVGPSWAVHQGFAAVGVLEKSKSCEMLQVVK